MTETNSESERVGDENVRQSESDPDMRANVGMKYQTHPRRGMRTGRYEGGQVVFSVTLDWL